MSSFVAGLHCCWSCCPGSSPSDLHFSRSLRWGSPGPFPLCYEFFDPFDQCCRCKGENLVEEYEQGYADKYVGHVIEECFHGHGHSSAVLIWISSPYHVEPQSVKYQAVPFVV